MSLGVLTAPQAQGVRVTEKPTCPKCEAKQSYYRLKTKDYQCRACGNSWKPEEKKKR